MKRKHTEETKAKIAAGNTGKVFSEERRRNIGEARKVILSEEQLATLRAFWDKRYVPERIILETLNISQRVYLRYKKEFCSIEQIKFLPQHLSCETYETIIKLCNDKIPYKDIADLLQLEDRQVFSIIEKLASFYSIEAIIKPRQISEKTEEHKEKLSKLLIEYNKANPKKKENNPNWKGGVTELSELIRKSDRYIDWRFDVLKRDNFTCLQCGAKRRLQADHIKQFCLLLDESGAKTYEQAFEYEPLWNLANGRTLCATCHRKTETYGKQRSLKEIIT